MASFTVLFYWPAMFRAQIDLIEKQPLTKKSIGILFGKSIWILQRPSSRPIYLEQVGSLSVHTIPASLRSFAEKTSRPPSTNFPQASLHSLAIRKAVTTVALLLFLLKSKNICLSIVSVVYLPLLFCAVAVHLT